MSEKERIAAATGVVGTATFLSRILGYVRDMVIAYFFGAGMATDAFFVAFRIPNTLRRLFGEGSLTVSFIPVFSEYLQSGERRDWEELVNAAFTLLALVLAGMTLLGVFFSPLVIRILAPGFADPGQFRLAVSMTRMVFPYLFFIGLVALSMGVLNALGHFAAPALAPVLLNISMIVSAFLLFHRVSPPVKALAIGVILGGVAQFLFQIPFLVRKGVRFRPSFRFLSNPGIRRIAALMLPAVGSTAVVQINIFVSQILASFLMKGSISFLYYAYRLVEFPLGIFVVALGTAALPSFSRLVVQKRSREFKEAVGFSLRMVLFFTVPAMAGLVALRLPIIRLLFQRGAFDSASTLLTSQALLYYAVGLWAIAGTRVVAPAFFAFQDMRSPVKVATFALAANLLFGLVLMGPLRHSGLALANSLSAVLNFFLLLVYLTRRIGSLDWQRMGVSLVKVVLASLAMTWVIYIMSHLGRWSTSEDPFLGGMGLALSILAGIGTYGVTSLLVRSEEAWFLVAILGKKVRKGR